MQPWEGVMGTPPDAPRLLHALSTQDIFTYCGHGAGERYLGGEGGEKLKERSVRSTAILMGCSSGRLKRAGPLEPRGMALNYLMAGCPLAIACLWDVSDRDIDRFADALLRSGGIYVNPPPRAPDAKDPRAPPPLPGVSRTIDRSIIERSQLTTERERDRETERQRQIYATDAELFWQVYLSKYWRGSISISCNTYIHSLL